MDTQTAWTQLQSLFARYTDARQTQVSLHQFESLVPYFGVETAYFMTLDSFFVRAAIADIHIHRHFAIDQIWDTQQPATDYANSLPGSLVINLLYPQATDATRQGLIDLIDQGKISVIDWLLVWANYPVDSLPEFDELVDALLTSPYTRAEGWLAFPDGLTPTGLDAGLMQWLVGIYVAAFDRAPEHAGLRYWADQLQEQLLAGRATHDAIKSVARDITWSAQQHGEWDGARAPELIVDTLYLAVLGRSADNAGQRYWVDALKQGTVEPSEFLAVFLRSALESSGDAGYLTARIAVAAHAATPEWSGADITAPDLSTVLQGVHNVATALQAIASMTASTDFEPLATPTPILASTGGLPAADSPHDGSSLLADTCLLWQLAQDPPGPAPGPEPTLPTIIGPQPDVGFTIDSATGATADSFWPLV